MAEEITFADLELRFRAKCNSDPSFREEFIADPGAAVEKYTGQRLPEGYTVHVHVMTPTALHLVVPPAPDDVADELSDEQLDSVAGGELVLLMTWGVIFGAGAAGAAAVQKGVNVAKGGAW